jgi:hypothetical protein
LSLITGSTADINAGVASLRNGQTTLQLEAFFLSSAEFNALHVSNSDFLQAAYQSILFRAASPQEVTALTTMLNSGTTRGSIIASLLGSTEAKVATVQGDYAAILARAGDTLGVNYWSAALQSGSATLVDVAVAFFNFPEYKAKAAQTVG